MTGRSVKRIITLAMLLVMLMGIIFPRNLPCSANASGDIEGENGGVTESEASLEGNAEGYSTENVEEKETGSEQKDSTASENSPETVSSSEIIIDSEAADYLGSSDDDIIETAKESVSENILESTEADSRESTGEEIVEDVQGTYVLQAAKVSARLAAGKSSTQLGAWQGDVWKYDFDSVSFSDKDIENATGTENLYLAPCILYDYKEGRPGKSNGSDIYRNEDYVGNRRFGSWSLEWYNQFAYFDGVLTFEYYNKYDIDEKMYIGATDALNEANSRPLKYLWQGGDINKNQVLMWAVNHNLSGSPVDYYISSLGAGSNMNGSTALAGLAGNTLDENGNITIGNTGCVMPYFNNDFLSESYGGTGSLANIYGAEEPVAFPFRKDGDYYVFDSTAGEDNVYYTDGKLRYSYNTNIVYDFDVPWAGVVTHEPGFFPFNDTNENNKDSAVDTLNYGNGLRVDIPFTIPEDGSGNEEDIVFDFSGDDDLWVYVDGHLVLDMGGAHSMSTGSINFTRRKVTVDSQAFYSNETISGGKSVTDLDDALCSPGRVHTLTVFYMERGLYKSNLHIEFNFRPVELTEHYYAEIGTPVYLDIPKEVYEYVSRTGVDAVQSDNPGASDYEIVNVNGENKIKYTSRPENNEAFAEKLFIQTENAVVTITVNNYKTNDDVYVIDYGLPVELHSGDRYDLFYNDKLMAGTGDEICELGISVSGNGFKGIDSRYTEESVGLDLNETASGAYGTASVKDRSGTTYSYGSYSYRPEKFMDGTDTFYYAVQVVKAGSGSGGLSAKNATPVMTSRVTIVPASTVYYEDNFSYNYDTGNTSEIIYSGNSVVINNTGLYIIQSNNQDDIYGYDAAYAQCLSDGLGGAQELGDGSLVQFCFTGTGFDIIARAADTAAVTYIVVNENNEVVRMGSVDTYYNNGTLYQLPVISVTDLERARYTVKFLITASGAGSDSDNVWHDACFTSFYFDGIRIYNPLDDETAEKYYKVNEYKAEIYPVHGMVLGDGMLLEKSIADKDGNIIDTESVNVPGSMAALVSIEDGDFINGTAVTENMSGVNALSGVGLVELLHSGPNNELYLDSSSAIAFYVEEDESAAPADRTLQIEVKAVQTGTVDEKTEYAGLELSVNGNKLADINTASAMYYNIPVEALKKTEDGRYLVLIQGDDSDSNVLSFTNLKVNGYKIEPLELESRGIMDENICVETACVKEDDTNTVERKMEFTFTVKFKGTVNFNMKTGSIENFKLNANGKAVTIRDITDMGGGEYEIKTLAPNGVGTYKYDFIYENADGTLAVTSIAVKVTSGLKQIR